MADGSDPRVFFAAERTLLAWLRTALGIIGLGFVVARFGLFLRTIGHQAGGATPFASTAIGVGFVALGGLAVGGAAWQHIRFCRGLTPAERPPGYWTGFAVWIALAVAMAAVVLSVYLVQSSSGPIGEA